MRKTPCLTLIITLFVVFSYNLNEAYAQYYRPPFIKWYQINTPHFRIIYPSGEDSAARHAGRILESQYKVTARFTGGKLHNFPVILNDYNDLSNGFVTSDMYRMEVEIPAIKGKSMNPRTGGWFENVFPHELTHALHISVTPWPGVSAIIKPFSPDYARSMNYNAQMGFHEGLAVYRETNVRPDIGGRGNYSFFKNQFYSNLDSPDRWTMGQLLTITGDNRPFERHYIGGYEFVNWLDSTFGKNTTRNIINFDSRWPFLGLGVAMWHQTAEIPSELYNKFELDQKSYENARLDSIQKVGRAKYQIINLPFTGTYVRRPKWISEYKIIFYGSFYNTEPGLWIYNTQTKKVKRFLKTNMVDDYRYDLNLKKQTLLYSNYRSSPFFNNDFKTDVYEVSLKNKHVQRLTTNKRVFSPVYHGGTVWALQTDHQSADWVTINKKGKISTNLKVLPNNLVAIQPNPVDTSLVAVVANRNGVQGIWLIQDNDKNAVLHNAPDIDFRDASIFDPVWSHNGQKLLFTCDYGGVMNLYEYSRIKKSVVQLTNTYYNAFEGSFSPDGNEIAFVSQHGDFKKLSIIKRANFLDKSIPRSVWHANLSKRMNAPRLASYLKSESRKWKSERYVTGLTWLRPRSFYPYYFGNNTFTGRRFGAVFESSDFLQKNYYSLDLSTSNNRLWYNLSYQFSGFFPGLTFSLYDQPRDFLNKAKVNNNYLYYGMEKNGVDISMPIPVVTKENVQYSSLTIIPKIRFFNERYITNTGKIIYINGRNLSKWYSSISGDLYAAYNWNLQQNIRDVQPNSGTIIYGQVEKDFKNQISDTTRTALRVGLYQYLAPLKTYNQSLRVGLILQTQTGIPLFNTYDIISDGFKNNVLRGLNNVASFSTKYTIPILSPDNGWFLIPVYFQQIYANLFSDTAMNLDYSGFNNLFNHSRTVYGIGIHFITGLSNLRINLGFSIGYEPTRNKLQGFITLY